jgi:hypothetical protein
MAAAAVPNSRLKQFEAEIGRGKVLLMIDVPRQRIAEITDVVVSRHPEALPGGEALRLSLGAGRIALERPEVARVVVELAAVTAGKPARIAEDRQRRELAGRRLRGQLP